MSTSDHISVVVPFFNEAENLPLLVEEIAHALDPTGWSYEVWLVDDGSDDGGAQVAWRSIASHPQFQLVRLRRNRGQSAALVAGFRRCRGDVVVTLDADLQNDPLDIVRLVEALPGHDMVCGVRVRRQDRWSRRAASKLANSIRRRVVGDGVRDVGCSLKAYRAKWVRHLPAWDGVHRFLPVCLSLVGGRRVCEIPVHHRPRRHGKSKYTIAGRAWRGLYDLIGVRWMQSRWIDPSWVDDVDVAISQPESGARAATPRGDAPRGARTRSESQAGVTQDSVRAPAVTRG